MILIDLNIFQCIFSFMHLHHLETKRLKDQALLGKRNRIFSLNLLTVSVESHLFSIYPWRYLTLLTQEITENFHGITTHLAPHLVKNLEFTRHFLWTVFYHVYELTCYGQINFSFSVRKLGQRGAGYSLRDWGTGRATAATAFPRGTQSPRSW